MQPQDLSKILEINGRTLKKYLRNNHSWDEIQWVLTFEQINEWL